MVRLAQDTILNNKLRRTFSKTFGSTIFILFFSSACLCQVNTDTPADTKLIVHPADDDKGKVVKDIIKGEIKKGEETKKDEEVKKGDEVKKDKETKKEKAAGETGKEETAETQEETLETWDESVPSIIKDAPPDYDDKRDIWTDREGFIDR